MHSTVKSKYFDGVVFCVFQFIRSMLNSTKFFNIIKNATILNNIHNTYNLRDTVVVICITLVLIKRVDVLNIR